MPLYSYECQTCGKEMDKVYPIENCPRVIECIHCRREAKKVLTIGHGGIQTDGGVTWLPSACETLQTPRERKERPITSRTEWKKTMKDKGLIPIG